MRRSEASWMRIMYEIQCVRMRACNTGFLWWYVVAVPWYVVAVPWCARVERSENVGAHVRGAV